MALWELFLIAVGLSMDAFAVSICKGLSVSKLKPKHMLITGLYFGGFQALMPFIGWLLGIKFQSLIESVDHWIAFVLLGLIGANMIREALGDDDDKQNDLFTFKAMLPLAIATSIDALAIGVAFAFLNVQIGWAVLFIGIITFTLSAIGVKIGNLFGSKFEKPAEIVGGIVLILLGVKILLEHLGILMF
ncbi:MAG: manganese efflux pump MntP family protein [Lachnospiraceae bacterium]|nr:manganese efflux pump MntP family protein [Lachnospiraceae bacterium]